MINEGINIQILQNSSSKSHWRTDFRTNRQEKENLEPDLRIIL